MPKAQSFKNKENQYALVREVSRIKAYSSLANVTDGSNNFFFDPVTGANGGSIGALDTTKTTLTGAVAVGTTDLSSVLGTVTGPGFKTGQEVTIQDDLAYETTTVTNFTSSTQTNTYTQTGVNVVASGYDTSYNNGRRLVRLSNGWFVAVLYNTGTSIIWYKSTDNGATWSQLCYNNSTATAGIAMCASGTTVWTLSANQSGTGNGIIKFDATTVSNSSPVGSAGNGTVSNPESGQTSQGSGCSIAIDGNGNLHAAWCSKNSTYNSSFNIRYSKSTDGGTTWAAPTQISTYNAAGTDATYPCIVVRNNNPIIVSQVAAANNQIFVWGFNGSTWATSATVYAGSSYAQAFPCAVVDGNGTLHCVWEGMDATYTSTYQIKYSKSTDGGATWSAATNLTSVSTSGQHQQYPSITYDASNNIYVDFCGVDTAIATGQLNIRRIIYNGTAWGSIVTLTNNTTANAAFPQTVVYSGLVFTDPPCIYCDAQANAVKYRGSFNATVTVTQLQVNATKNAYKSGAILYRSLGSYDTTNKKITFSYGFAASATATQTGVNIAASAYDTYGNGGRKLIRLGNGWLVAGVFDGTAYVKLYLSKDNGATWANLANSASITATNQFALAYSGTTVYVLGCATGANGVYFAKFDAASVTMPYTFTIGNSTQAPYIDSAQTMYQNCSLAVDGTGALHAVWTSRNATYANSTNLRYSKSTDNGVTWSSPIQVSTANSSGQNMQNPCMVIRSNSPVILCEYKLSDAQIVAYTFNGSVFNPSNIYDGVTYGQICPCGTVDNSGTIHCTWSGTSATYTQNHVYYAKSTDGGITWSTATVIDSSDAATYSQSPGSITTDANNNVYVVWFGVDASSPTYNQIRKISCINGTWGSITDLTTNASANTAYPQTLEANSLTLTDPVVMYQDSQAGAVKFRGSWTATTYNPFTTEHLRFNLTPATPVSTITAFVDHETDATFSYSAAASFHTGTAESFANVQQQASFTVDGSTTEERFVGWTTGNAQPAAALRVTMARSATTNNRAIKVVHGMVGS